MTATGPLSKLRVRWWAESDGRMTEDASVLTLWLSASDKGLVAAPVTIGVAYEDPLTGAGVGPGVHVELRHTGAFECTTCGKGVKKLFDGHCFPCLRSKASADQCVMSPHLCHFAAGTCREPQWGLDFCFQTHYVYLSFTDKFKVGITRASQIPLRWVDQGATAACLLARVSSRHQAGVIEKILTAHIADKSHWANMIKAGNTAPDPAAFAARFAQVRAFLASHPAIRSGESIVDTPAEQGGGNASVEFFESPRSARITFPLPSEDRMPAKIVSTSFDKVPELSGEVLGVKGQYLLLSDRVFNVRRHEGYVATSGRDSGPPAP